jgi:response regulator NasT
MERHSIDDQEAFQRLREVARSGGRRVVDVSQAVLDGHTLLPKQPS